MPTFIPIKNEFKQPNKSIFRYIRKLFCPKYDTRRNYFQKNNEAHRIGVETFIILTKNRPHKDYNGLNFHKPKTDQLQYRHLKNVLQIKMHNMRIPSISIGTSPPRKNLDSFLLVG